MEDVPAVVGNGAARRSSLRPAVGVAVVGAREADDVADKQNHRQIQLTSSVAALMCRYSTSDVRKVMMMRPRRPEAATVRDRPLWAQCRA